MIVPTTSRAPEDRLGYARRRARIVRVGDVGIGGDEPIRVQSMTTTATTDTLGTAAQIERLVDAGCEIVRVTVPTSKDAENLPAIRRELRARGVRVPLVADIHFTPAAALLAAEHVEKVRINPGNFADKKKFAVREYTDAEYAAEIERIETLFDPLVRRCKQLGVAMRIGTNHGSLSDRIVNRYGDTPLGMVESALEFVRICEARGYRELVLSMKASNPVVVLQAYRLLVERMEAEGMDYPLHLGVTEAGDGEDGRIKSAIGIGALLEDGIGDTVRVSLTEDPVAEIPVARALVARFNRRAGTGPPRFWGRTSPSPPSPTGPPSGASFLRRTTREERVGPRFVGGTRPVLVEVPLVAPVLALDEIRRELDAEAGVRVPEETRAELVSVEVRSPDEIAAAARLRASMELVAPSVALSMRVVPPLGAAGSPVDVDAALAACHRVHVVADASDPASRGLLDRWIAAAAGRPVAILVETTAGSGAADGAVELAADAARAARAVGTRLLVTVSPVVAPPLKTLRDLASRLDAQGLDVPLVLLDRPSERGGDPVLAPSAALGGLLCEGIGDAVHIDLGGSADSRRLAFNILQGARVRISKTEFISCPSCGRTLFDLETTTARIKARTAHLKGLKIAVMGCIVNGPGEMADADFGYVGWGEDRIALFVGKELVEKDVPTSEADARLVALIKRQGLWVEPPSR